MPGEKERGGVRKSEGGRDRKKEIEMGRERCRSKRGCVGGRESRTEGEEEKYRVKVERKR